jgi:predicted DsbA family dithiol-disulfide isomerase
MNMKQQEKRTIHIDVLSDVVCPWCYIGKRRLEKALTVLNEKFDFTVTYHPFELNPTMPEAGVNQQAYLTRKFGDAERYTQIINHVTGIALKEGLDFRFDKQQLSPNTRKAHALIQFAREFDKQSEVKENLMKAYFTDGLDLSLDENLVNIALQSGLPGDSVKGILSDKVSLEKIEQAEKEWQKLSITGVPFYIFDKKYGLSGAQPVETFMAVINNASGEPPA